MPDAIHNKVSEWMGRKRMSIADLMRQTGLSYYTAWSLYHDKSSRIEFGTLAKLCKGLELDVGDLFEYVPETEEPQ